MIRNNRRSTLTGKTINPTCGIKNILVIKPSSLGDVLHAFPAVTMLAEAYPNASIDWLINKSFAPLVKFHPNVKQSIIFPRKELGNIIKFPKSFLSLVKNLRKKNYDLIVDFQGLMRSAIFAKLAKSSTIYGFANPKETLSKHLYNKKITIPKDIIHAVDKNLYLVSQIVDKKPLSHFPKLKILNNEKKSIFEKLKIEGIEKSDICIGIAPSARWESKSWPPGFFAETIDIIAQKHKYLKFLIIGVPEDQKIADAIISKSTNKNIISMTGKSSMGELVELIRYCKIFISNDSGPMHIASAIGTPVFALFGPTDSSKTGPYGEKHHLFKSNLNCEKCLRRECPIGTNECHTSIDVHEFANKIIQELEN